MSRRIFLAVVAIVALCSGACGRRSGSASTESERAVVKEQLSVVATVYPLADVAKQIGGKWVSLEWVLERGQTLTKFSPDETTRARLNSADLLITGGGAEESWAVEGYENAFRANRLIRLDVLDVSPTPDALPAAATNAPAGSATPPPASVAEGELWLDPVTVQRAADVIASHLAALRPQGESDFRQNSKAFKEDLAKLLAEFEPRLEPVKLKRVLVLTDRYNALLRRYAIQRVHVVDQPSPLRLTDNDIARLRQEIESPNLPTRTLLLEADTPPAVADELATRLGVQVLFINSLGSSSTIGPTTYQALTRYNLEQLTRIP
jgi:zinc transport system substrate-binding protein